MRYVRRFQKRSCFRMKDGDKVIAGGRVDVYERDGAYQSMRRRIT